MALGTLVDSNVLLDVYIAAHVAMSGRALLSRDRPRYLHLLPTLEVIAPD